MASDRGAEQGFSLVEVLTALAIAALAMVALYRAVLQSSTATAALENHYAATVLARSLLDDAAQAPVSGRFKRSGTQGKLSWTLTAGTAEPAAAALAPRGMALYDLSVTVTWAPRGKLELSTLALGR
jgi:prepilin-type N-terminal cleavage/methylation domain-containing protein